MQTHIQIQIYMHALTLNKIRRMKKPFIYVGVKTLFQPLHSHVSYSGNRNLVTVHFSEKNSRLE